MLLQLERFADAERAFREDLDQYPENGWSLFGLATALEAQGRTGEAQTVRTTFDTAWSTADAEPRSGTH